MTDLLVSVFAPCITGHFPFFELSIALSLDVGEYLDGLAVKKVLACSDCHGRLVNIGNISQAVTIVLLAQQRHLTASPAAQYPVRKGRDKMDPGN
jgi:hypothetical protein